MRFMFYRPDRSPVEVSGTYVTTNFERMTRPVPRIGERVVIDGDYCEVTDIVHIVQNAAEVRIFIKEVER